jgi:hypothetical protein
MGVDYVGGRKMRISRVFAAISAGILMVSSISGCKEKPIKLQAYEIYKTAMRQNKETASMDVDMEMKSAFEISGQQSEMKMSGNMKVQTEGSKVSAMSGNMELEQLGQKQPAKYFYKNGIMYIESNGMKVKRSMNYDKAMSAAGIGDLQKSADFQENAFENAKIEQDGDLTTISTSLPKDVMNAFVKDKLDQVSGMAGESGTLTYDSAIMVFTVNKKGDLVSMSVSLNARIEAPKEDGSAEKQEMKIDMIIKYTINNPGKPVTITTPTDLDSYVEASEDENPVQNI